MAERTGAYPLGAVATIAELERDPHPLLARLREQEPVSWLPALDGWLVTRRDLALAVMRDPDVFTVDDPRFSTAQVVGPSMLSLDGDEHLATAILSRHRFGLMPCVPGSRTSCVLRPTVCSRLSRTRARRSYGGAWRGRSPLRR